MKAASDSLKSIYDTFKDKEWDQWKPEDVALTKLSCEPTGNSSVRKRVDHPKILKKLQRLMEGLVALQQRTIRALPYMKMGWGSGGAAQCLAGAGSRCGEQVTTYWNLDWKTWDYPTHQPAKIPDRKDVPSSLADCSCPEP